ncbi:reverse transcriptase domain-containing protein [Tanacetum coccineum]
MEKTYTWIEAKEVTTNGIPNDQRENFKRSRKSSWDNNRGQKGRDRFSPYRGPNHGLLFNLSKRPREILATKRQLEASNSLLIEEDVKSRQLSYLVKGIKKERDESYTKNKFEGLTFKGKEITFPSGGEKSWSVGKIPLEITIGDAPLTRKETLNFVIVKSDSPYNMLLGRTEMLKMGIVVSTIHGAIKFHTTKRIGTVFSTHESNKVKEGMKKYPEQTVTIGKQLPEHFKGRLQDLPRANVDVFAWTHADMTGIHRTITVKGNPFNTERKLNEYSHVKPIKQKRRGLGSDRSTAACKEVEELMKAGGYNQIQMAEGDEDKTAFFAREGVFCYRKMPFGLKNAGATYQRLVDKVFHDQIGRNLEAYVDDMVIKSTSKEEMLADIKETFEKFRSINMKLNPKKCSFGVEEGPFLGHLITKQGIRAKLSKVKAITNVEQLKTLKDVQSLNKKIAALSRFLSKGAERSLLFFKVLKSCTDEKNIQWTQEVEAAL